MGKDVIDDRYARLYEYPYQLARLGHHVHAYCLGYQGQAETQVEHSATPGTLRWVAYPFSLRHPLRSLRYPRQLLRSLRALDPDLLIGASDIPQVGLTAWLSRKLGVPYAVDLYDNFESFGQARVPGMKKWLRRATREAGIVTTTSEPLRELVVDTYRVRGKVIAMPSTVDLSLFRVRDKLESRRSLGLPVDAFLIGTAGGLHLDKGLDALYTAWPVLAASHPTLHLVLAGPYKDGAAPPKGPRVHYLGQLAHARTAELFSALDLGVVYMRDTLFGRYCFPQKAYEMIACGLPLVSASVGAMKALLHSNPDSLYRADDVADLVRAVNAQCASPQKVDTNIDDWATIIKRLEPELITLASSRN